MNIPSFNEAEIPAQKVLEYLLRLDHPEGTSKAKFFLGCGFSVERWQQFAEALRKQAAHGKISKIVEGRFGTKFIIDAQIQCPDSSSRTIRTVWIRPLGQKDLRLVTAHPLD